MRLACPSLVDEHEIAMRAQASRVERDERPFVVDDADGIRVTAATGETIAVAGNTSASAGKIESTTIGDTIHLKCYRAGSWRAESYVGTWTVT